MAIFADYYYHFCLLWGEGGLKKGQKSSYVVFECSGPKYEAKKNDIFKSWFFFSNLTMNLK